MTQKQLENRLMDKFPGGMKRHKICEYFDLSTHINLEGVEYFIPPGGKQKRYPADAVAKWLLQNRVPSFMQEQGGEKC
jgi:hypothetical protein